MRFRLYREHGALNSKPIFDAVEQGLKSLGHEIVDRDEDIPVIWSVLWNGRMSANQQIYYTNRRNNKPVMIVEVGNLFRNKTWRISLNHVNSQGIFGNQENLDHSRPEKLGIELKTTPPNRRGEILIATQHQRSLQWEGMPAMKTWVENTISEIKKYSTRRIIVRPHPRSLFPLKMPGVIVESPKKLPNSYDDFDIFYDYHCVINFNSGPAVQAAIKGIPVICDYTSLAGELTSKIENIETVSLPDRQEWFVKLCHTEWTVPEIESGTPFSRILTEIPR